MELAFKRPDASSVSNRMKCIKCSCTLKNIDVGLHKKMINRGSTEFMCIDCLSKYIGVSKEELLRKAEYFKKMGCVLF